MEKTNKTLADYHDNSKVKGGSNVAFHFETEFGGGKETVSVLLCKICDVMK